MAVHQVIKAQIKGIQQMVVAAPLLGHAGDAGVASIRDDALFGLKPA
ncbi:MAG: hypothetical protein WCG47_19040 [Dermatophilaceae bacterium]